MPATLAKLALAGLVGSAAAVPAGNVVTTLEHSRTHVPRSECLEMCAKVVKDAACFEETLNAMDTFVRKDLIGGGQYEKLVHDKTVAVCATICMRKTKLTQEKWNNKGTGTDTGTDEEDTDGADTDGADTDGADTDEEPPLVGADTDQEAMTSDKQKRQFEVKRTLNAALMASPDGESHHGHVSQDDCKKLCSQCTDREEINDTIFPSIADENDVAQKTEDECIHWCKQIPNHP